MREVLLGLVLPWVTMLPFVLVVIAAIDMIKDWLPSRLPVEPEEPFEGLLRFPGPNGFAMRVTDSMIWGMQVKSRPADFVKIEDPYYP